MVASNFFVFKMIFSFLLVAGASAAAIQNLSLYTDDACTTLATGEACTFGGEICTAAEKLGNSCVTTDCGATVTYEEGNECNCFVAMEDNAKKTNPECDGAGGVYTKMEFNCGETPSKEDCEKDGKLDNKGGDDGESGAAGDDGESGAAALSLIVALVTPFLAMF